MSLLEKLLPWLARDAGRREAENGLHAREREQRLQANKYMLRHFLAASEDRRRRDWWSLSFSGDAELLTKLPLMRSRSRLMVDNDAKAAGLIHKEVTNTIGPRFTARAKIPGHVARQFGLDEEAGRSLSYRAEEFWSERVARLDSRDRDWRRLRPFLAYIRLMFRHYKTDGGLFLRFLYTPDRPVPFAVRIIEPECVGTPPALSGNPRVSGGLQFSEAGELEGFWVAQAHPGGISAVAASYEFVPVKNEFGLPQMVFLFDPHRETASREIPWLHPVLLLLNDVADYKDSELQRKVVEADVALYCTLNKPDEAQFSMEGDGAFGTEGQSANERSTVKWAKRQIQYLEANEDIKVIDPQRPGNIYVPFLDSHDRDIGNGLGRSFERVSNNYGAANFSATRVSGIEDFVEHETEFALFSSAILSPMWEWAMWALALAEGEPVFRSVEAEWQRYIKPSWSPIDDAEAATERLANGTSDPYEEAAMRGRDYEEVVAARVRAETFSRDSREESGLPPEQPQAQPGLDAAVDQKIKKAAKGEGNEK